METKAGLLLVFVVLALSAATTNATIVTIGLTAEITNIDRYSQWLNENFKVGDIITGSYTYDTDTPDTNPLSTVADYVYTGAPYGINLNINGFTIQSSPDSAHFLISFANNHTGADFYGFISYNNLPFSNGIPIDIISWQLDDYSCNALSSTELSSQPPDLEDWPRQGLLMTFGYKGGSILGAKVTSVQIVPEPATLFLLMLGGLVLLKKSQS
jgi:hypothetical protein